MAGVAPAKPADPDRRDADHGRRRAAQEDHRKDQREKTARDLDVRGGVRRRDVAGDREDQQDGEEAEVPVGVGGNARHDRARERDQLEGDDDATWLDRQGGTSEEAVKSGIGPRRLLLEKENGRAVRPPGRSPKSRTSFCNPRDLPDRPPGVRFGRMFDPRRARLRDAIATWWTFIRCHSSPDRVMQVQMHLSERRAEEQEAF